MASPGLDLAHRLFGDHGVEVDLDVVSTEDLLDAWRDATRAAELAERLAATALRAAERAEQDAAAAEEIATLAEEAAAAAERAAEAARAAANKASLLSNGRTTDSRNADQAVVDARTAETDASDRYHDADADDRQRHEEELAGR